MKLIRSEITLDDFANIDNQVKKLGKALITIEKYEEHLSENQRKYYFWVCVATCMADEQWSWYTREEIHHELKIQYLPEYDKLLKDMWEETNITDMMKRFLNLYHDLTITTTKKWEFEEYLNRIRIWESKKGIFIPLPNEENWWQWAELVWQK